jgi:hypothetical protein
MWMNVEINVAARKPNSALLASLRLYGGSEQMTLEDDDEHFDEADWLRTADGSIATAGCM